MRLIDADRLYDWICDMTSSARHTVISVTNALECIEGSPTIDAEPVVRCNECVCCSMWNDQLICSRISNVMDGYYHGTVEVVNPDDYCSRGVRQKAKPCGAKMDEKEE